MSLPKIGDQVTFAGGRYPVQDVWEEENITGELTTLVLIASSESARGWSIPLNALKEYSPETAAKRAAEEAAKQKALDRLAETHRKLRAKMEREKIRDAKPQRFKFRLP